MFRTAVMINKSYTPDHISLSIIIPSLNERNNIIPTIERLEDALQEIIEDYEIIVINDGSTDGTDEVVKEYIKKHSKIRLVCNEKNLGLGSCYILGIGKATKDYFVYIPGDNTWPYKSFRSLFRNIGKASVITSYASNPEVRYFSRRVVSSMYTKTLNLLFSQKMNYFNGLTVYPVKFLKATPITSKGFGFQAEILLKAIYKGLSVVELELPIDERTAGSSKAVNIKNILGVANTVVRLFWDLRMGSWCQKNNFNSSDELLPADSSIPRKKKC